MPPGDRHKGSKKGQSQRGFGDSREAVAAKRLGMETTPGSGSGPGHHKKMDLRPSYADERSRGEARPRKADFQIEVKATRARSFRLDEPIIRAATQKAATIGRKPAIEVHVMGLKGACEYEWVCVPAAVFKELVDG